MDKRGGIDLSFGMIFTIIVVIAIIGAAIYVIMFFLGLQECTEEGLFYSDLQSEVDTLWRSDFGTDTFEAVVPPDVTTVCVGDLNSPGSGEEYDKLYIYRNSGSNVFLYPTDVACNAGHTRIEHVQNEPFECYPVTNRRVRLGLSKGPTDALVSISAP